MNYSKFFSLEAKIVQKLKKIPGPILILGSGGFVGSNVLASILLYRKDVYGVFQNPLKNWRRTYINFPQKSILTCDVANENQMDRLLQKIKPQTIFNFAAYGAYPIQSDVNKIYTTNFLSTIKLLEMLKKQKFSVYIHAGSSSEYGENSQAPKETKLLTPNSHYAVSKASDSLLMQFYGKYEKLPVIHTRLYSVYGPFEDTARLVPVAVQKARKKTYPKFVNGNISRDFIYTIDITSAFIVLASEMNKNFYGEVFNIGTGKKTTIKNFAFLLKNVCKIKSIPKFNKLKKRDWDHTKDWYADIKKIKNMTTWKPKVTLKKGLKQVIDWQNEIGYDDFLEKYEK